jgi:predicted nuclease of predicted toxin-antitoxin system
VKFLIDAQLPPALARWLVDGGHEAVHVEEVGLRAARDGAVWTHALHNDAILVTKDEDFATRATQAETSPIVVWLRVGNTTNRALRAWIDARMPGILRLASQGHRLIEVI